MAGQRSNFREIDTFELYKPFLEKNLLSDMKPSPTYSQCNSAQDEVLLVYLDRIFRAQKAQTHAPSP